MNAKSVLDDREFEHYRDGTSTTGAPHYWINGEVWWLYETEEPNTYVVLDNPFMDADENGYYPSYNKILVVSPDGEREATNEESDYWDEWAREVIREGCCDD